jgi:cytoskeletal protein CcmA (bactofilin family)
MFQKAVFAVSCPPAPETISLQASWHHALTESTRASGFMETRSISKNSLIVGEGVVIEGTIITTGSIEIRGTVKGEVSALDILVRKSGVVGGSIVTTDITVEGLVKDKLKVAGHLEIMSSGTVSGTIEYSSIQIEKGANINGNLSRTGDSTPTPSNAAKTPPAESTAPQTETDAEASAELDL